MDKKLIERIKNLLVDGLGPEAIYLFGSAADNSRYDPQKSDIDLLLIRRTSLPFRKRYAEARSCLRDLAYPFDILSYTPGEFDALKDDVYSVVHNAVKNGIKIYEK